MAEDEGLAFDPSLKKKKKKKAFDLDAALAEDSPAAAAPADDVSAPAAVSSKGSEPAFDEADADRAAAKAASKAEALNMDDLDLDNLDSFGDKKKKKKKKRKGEDAVAEEGGEDPENQENQSAGSGDPWTGSDRDYTYDELLKRVFTIIQEKNPEMATRHAKGFVMRPPQVVRSGTKKTAFVNFMDIAKALHRQPKHLLAFLQAELGTVGTIDGSNQLILKGKFQQRNIETVLRKYIKEYVFCHTCLPGHHPE